MNLKISISVIKLIIFLKKMRYKNEMIKAVKKLICIEFFYSFNNFSSLLNFLQKHDKYNHRHRDFKVHFLQTFYLDYCHTANSIFLLST